MRPIATDVWRGLCVCHVTVRYPAKMPGPIEMPFGIWGGVGPSNHVLDEGSGFSQGKWKFWGGEEASNSKV